MAIYKGQTDQPLVIKLPSAIVTAHFLESEVAANGECGIEVQTRFVAEGSPIKIKIFDGAGTTLETLEGKVFSDTHRRLYRLPNRDLKGALFFEAELPKHGLKLSSQKIKALPYILINPVQILNKDGSTPAEIQGHEELKLEAKIQGAPVGKRGQVSVYLATRTGANHLLYKGESEITQGKISVQWKFKAPEDQSPYASQGQLQPYAEDYATPKIFLRAQCLGVSADSSAIPFVSWIEFDFKQQKGKATFVLPDGSEKKLDVPNNGLIRLEKPKAGVISLKNFEAIGSDGKPLAYVISQSDEPIDAQDQDSDSQNLSDDFAEEAP